jgi:uncharacterized membrane protein YphA (DoxX/SURF4 family)
MENKKLNKISFLIMRVMLSLIFLVASINHLKNPEKIAGRLQKSEFAPLVTSIADPAIMVTLAGVGLLIGGVMLVAGFKTRIAAILLIMILIPITITVQLKNPEGLGPLFKNIAMMGGLIFFAINGSVFYGVDEIKSNNHKQIHT